MRQRQSTLLLPAVVIVAIAGPAGWAGAADDCLTKPNGPAPRGAHWYYRLDKVNKRQCWYVRAPIGRLPRASTVGASLHAPDARAQAVAEPLEPAPRSPPPAAAPAAVPGAARSPLARRWSVAAAQSAALPTPMEALPEHPPSTDAVAVGRSWVADVAQDRRRGEARISPERTHARVDSPASSGRARGLVALIMATLALAAIAGPVLQVARGPRRRQSGGYGDVGQRRTSWPSASGRRASASLHDPVDVAAGPRPEMPEWPQDFARAWRRLAVDA